MDFGRIHRGELVATVAGLILIASLFIPWYHAEPNSGLDCSGNCSAFNTFSMLRWWLIAGGLTPLILVWIVLRAHQLSWAPGEITAIVGMIVVTLILYNGVVDRPGDFGVSLRPGYFLGLLAGIGIAVGGGMRASEVSRPVKPPGTF